MTSMVAAVRASFATRVEPHGTPAFHAMQAARWRSAVAWLFGGTLAVPPLTIGFVAVAVGGSPWSVAALILTAAVVAWALGVGLVQLVRFDAESQERRGTTIALSVGVIIALVLGLGWPLLAIMASPLVMIAAALVGAFIIFAMFVGQRGARAHVGAVLASLAIALVIAGVAVADGLIALPLTLVPGVPLDEIYAHLRDTREDAGISFVVIGAASWAGAAVLVGLTALIRRVPARRAVGAVLGCGLLALTTMPMWQFGMGMGLADAFGVGGGQSGAMPLIGLITAILSVVCAWLLIGPAPPRADQRQLAATPRTTARQELDVDDHRGTTMCTRAQRLTIRRPRRIGQSRHMDELPEALSELFDAERQQDWERLRSRLDPDVEWTLVGREESRVHGADAYVSRLRAAYEHESATPFTVRHVRRGAGGLVATELIDELGNISLDIFELSPKGQVVREWEHLFGRPTG